MWQQYKKTFVGMQALIALVTGISYWKMYGLWQPALQIFLVMQVAGFVGAYWATQIRNRVRRFGSSV